MLEIQFAVETKRVGQRKDPLVQMHQSLREICENVISIRLLSFQLYSQQEQKS